MAAAEFQIHIDTEFCLHQANEASFGLFTAPCQFLTSLTRVRVCNHRSSDITANRAVMKDADPIDFDLLRQVLSSIKDPDDKRIASWHATLSSINNSILHRCGQHNTGACPCGAPEQTLEHMVWECPLAEHLRDADPIISQLSKIDLPCAVKHGIPTLANSNPSGNLWGVPCSCNFWAARTCTCQATQKLQGMPLHAHKHVA